MSKKQTPAQVATTIANYIKKQEDVLAKYKSGPMANAARLNLEKAQKAMAALMQTNEAMRKQKMSEEQYDEVEDMMEGEESDEMRYGGMRKMPGGGKVPVNALLSALSQVQSQQPQGINQALMAYALQHAPSQDKLMSFVMGRYPQQQLNQMNPATLRTNPYVLMDYNNALQQINPAPRYNPPMMYGGLLEYMYGGNVGQKKKPAGVSNLRKMAEGGVPAEDLNLEELVPGEIPQPERMRRSAVVYQAFYNAGHPYPAEATAQWALESDWNLDPRATSFSGMKTGPDFDRIFQEAGIPFEKRVMGSEEFVDGEKVPQDGSFYLFPDLNSAVRANVLFLRNNKHFKDAMNAPNGRRYLELLQNTNGGQKAYSTNPNYVEKVSNDMLRRSLGGNATTGGVPKNIAEVNPSLLQLTGMPVAIPGGTSSARAVRAPDRETTIGSYLETFPDLPLASGAEVQKSGNLLYARNDAGGYNVIDMSRFNSSQSPLEQWMNAPGDRGFIVPAEKAGEWVNKPQRTSYTINYDHSRNRPSTTREGVANVLRNQLGQPSDVAGVPTYATQVMEAAGFDNPFQVVAGFLTNAVSTYGRLQAADTQVRQASGSFKTAKGTGTEGNTPYSDYMRSIGRQEGVTNEGARIMTEGLAQNLLGMPSPMTSTTFARTGFGQVGRAFADDAVTGSTALARATPGTSLARTATSPGTGLAVRNTSLMPGQNWIPGARQGTTALSLVDDATQAAPRVGQITPSAAQRFAQTSPLGTQRLGQAISTVAGVQMPLIADPLVLAQQGDQQLRQNTPIVSPPGGGDGTGDGGTGDANIYLPKPGAPSNGNKQAPNIVGPAEGGDNITIPNVSWMQAIPALASMASARIGQNALDSLQRPQAPVTTMVPQFEYQSNIGQSLQDVRNATTAMGRNTMMSSAQNAAMRQGLLAERFNQEARLRSADQQTRQQAEAQYQNLATNVRIANDALRNQYVQDSVAFENTRKMQDAQLRTVPLQTLSAGVSDYLKNVYGPGLANALYASNRPYDTQYNFDELLTPKKN
jgi:hypothetical protein